LTSFLVAIIAMKERSDVTKQCLVVGVDWVGKNAAIRTEAKAELSARAM
jgi:hypothetical protein